MQSGGGHIIEDNRFDGNLYDAIYLTGDGSVIQRNRLLNTGGSPFRTAASAIEASGTIDILDNTISGVVPTTNALKVNDSTYGVFLYSNALGSINGNRVRGLVKKGSGIVTGMNVAFSSRVTLRGNDLGDTGSAGGIGFRCSPSSSLSRIVSNVVMGFVTPNQGCAVGGGNELVP